MRSAVRRSVAGLACLLLGLSGCQPLNQTGSFKVGPGSSPHFVEVSAPASDQKVTVTITATEPVSAFLCTQDHAKEVGDAATYQPRIGPKTEHLLGGKKNEKEISFDALVPAKQPFTLVVAAEKDAEVTYKVVSR